MKYLLITIAVFVAIASNISCISTSEVAVNDKNTFPTVTGTNLHGDEKTLPDCLVKDKTILVVAYQRWQQDLCDAWYGQIEEFMAANEDTAYFEIPTISKMNGFMRWFIYRGMRGGITDPQMRRQVITLHIDKAPFNDALGIKSEKTVYVFVLNKEVKILAQEKGEYDKTKWARLEKVLKEEI